MVNKILKSKALDKAIEITTSYCSSGNPSLQPDYVLDICYKKLCELHEDAAKDS